MRVSFPKIQASAELERFLESLLYHKVNEIKDEVTFEGVFEFGIARQNIDLSTRDLESFVRAMRVEGGYKKIRGDMLLVIPHRNKRLNFRTTKAYVELLKKVAKRLGRKPSEHARIEVLNALQKALESHGWPKQGITKSKNIPPYKEETPRGNSLCSSRISKKQHELIEEVAEADGLTISQYARMVLENVLPKEATVLGITEPQTSESATRGG